MAEYHVGCGILGSAIYAGTLTKNKDKWLYRSTVTVEAISAAAQYLVMNDIRMGFEMNGKRYWLQAIEREEADHDEN